MAQYPSLAGKLVVLIGGGGFLGSHLAQELLRSGARLRIAERHPEASFGLKPLADLGQIQFARCNVKDRRSVAAAMHGADAAVYLVGTFAGDQFALQAEGAGSAAEAAAAAGAPVPATGVVRLGLDSASTTADPGVNVLQLPG